MIEKHTREIVQYTGVDEEGAEVILEAYNPAGVGPCAIYVGASVVGVGFICEKHEDAKQVDFILSESDDRHTPETIVRYYKAKELFEFNPDDPDADHTAAGM